LQRIRFLLSSDEREIERFEALLNGGSSFRSIVWSMLTVISLRRARSVIFWYRDLQCQFKGHQGCAGNSKSSPNKTHLFPPLSIYLTLSSSFDMIDCSFHLCFTLYYVNLKKYHLSWYLRPPSLPYTPF
jgi:hypothetical protein